MSSQFWVHPDAEIELTEAVAYYFSVDKMLAARFVAGLQHGVDHLKTLPFSGTPIASDVRRYALRGFPYRLIYSAAPDGVFVLALAHTRRRPFYWRNRIERPI